MLGESRTGVKRRHFYRLLERCLAPHDDGQPFGWRGLVPHARVCDYKRVADVAPRLWWSPATRCRAFAQLLKAKPSLAKWLADSVRNKRVAIDQLCTDDGLRVRLRGLK